MRLLLPLLLILIAFYFLRYILRGLTQGDTRSSFGTAGLGSDQRKRNVKLGKMEKDPVCGTFVDVTTSIQATFHGEVKYFCSPDCLKKYKDSH
jgi:YHS domain-containing protein